MSYTQLTEFLLEIYCIAIKHGGELNSASIVFLTRHNDIVHAVALGPAPLCHLYVLVASSILGRC